MLPRIAYLGSFENSWDTESYIARALERAECKVFRIEESRSSARSVIEACCDECVDLLLMAKARFGGQWDPSCDTLRAVAAELRERRKGMKIACWVFDLLSKEFNPERYQWAVNIDRIVDKFFLTDGYTAADLERAHVLRQACPDDVRTGRSRAEWRKDVLWLGGRYRYRDWAVERLSRYYKDRFLHVPEGVRGPALCDLMASVKVVVGPAWPQAPMYFSNRLYVVTGCGGFFLCPTVMGMYSEGWRAGVNYAHYDGDEDLIDTLDMWLQDIMEPDREEIAAAGTAHCRTNCTYDVRVRELLTTLGMGDYE